jgi:hypothetical protein
MKRPVIITMVAGLFFFCTIQSAAQVPCDELPLPEERVVLHLDRNICLAGETIWFKAWCFLDGQLDQEMSKVLYVEIFDETQKSIVQQKYLLNDHKAAGSIHIPEDVPSKYYFLKAYTRYMRNFSSAGYHYQQLIIVNPLIEGERIDVEMASQNKQQDRITSPPYTLSASPQTLKIELDQGAYQPRELINFSIDSPMPVTADLSVAVRLKGLGNHPARPVIQQNKWLMASCQNNPFCRQFYSFDLPSHDRLDEQKNENITGGNEWQWMPETRGLTISGVVQNAEQRNMAGASIILSLVQQKALLHMGTTDESGAFTICLQEMEGLKNLFIGTPNEENTVLIKNDFDPTHPDIHTVPLQFDTTIHRLLEALYLHQQLDRIYPENKTQQTTHSRLPSTPLTNILSPDRRIVMSDYIKLSTMSEVFKEIIPGILLRKVEGKENLSVFNNQEQRWYHSPLILLDNIPIFDIAELLKIDPSKIEVVEIYDSDYILGDYTIGGMISITSKTNDFAGYQWGGQVAFTAFKSFTASKPFKQVLHQEEGHYPDFRPVLYWQPGLPLRQEEKSDIISIYAPDRQGVYEIVVQGFTENGEPSWAYTTFEVVQNQ